MPGFLETQVYTGYGYLDPYVTPYVEKARNNVPLIDRAAKGVEEVAPKIITRVDEFTEPRIEKMRPIVEPRIEQVKEFATPYVDSGVKKYGAVKTEGCKYYSQAIEYKKSKVDQVQKIKDEKISWCKKMLCKKGAQVNQLFRVPATDNVSGMKFQGVLGKMAALMEKTEGLVDKCLPALPKGAPTPLESYSSEYDDSYLIPRMLLLVISIQTRLVHATKTKFDLTMQAGKTKFAKAKSYVTDKVYYFATDMGKKVKAIGEPKVKELKAVLEPKYKQMKNKVVAVLEPKYKQMKDKVAPKIEALTKTKEYNKACKLGSKVLTFGVLTCEKFIGTEKTKSLIQAVELRMPASWKSSPPAPAKKVM